MGAKVERNFLLPDLCQAAFEALSPSDLIH